MNILNYTPHAKNKGFTLVELAILIVIIGLLVGGVLQGQELIKQAQQRNLIKAMEGYIGAELTFEAKYSCMPGDCNKAYSLFGDPCDTNPAYCDGDGDRLVVYNYTGNDNETLRFWQHLKLAKMVNGNYNGVSNGGDYDLLNGLVVPKLPFKDTYVGVSANPVFFPNSPFKNYFIAGKGLGGSGQVRAQDPFLTPNEAYQLDLKIDDGMPYEGKLFTFPGWVTGVHATCKNVRDYNITLDAPVCTPMFGW